MPRYMVLYSANPAVWPTDPKQALRVLERVFAGADYLFKGGALKEVGWFTTQEGYAIFEADSKEKVLELVEPFFPYYSQDIHEIVSWEKGRKAILDGAKAAASM